MNNVQFKITGNAGLLMHSDKTANPLNDFTKRLKAVTSKRKKTDEDIADIAKIEWEASLYYENGTYILPSQNIEATLLASAKMFKQGVLFKQAITMYDDATFTFQHSKLKPMELYEFKQYIDQRTVKVGQAKTMRCRPYFREWESIFTLFYDDAKLNREDVINIVKNAGMYVGIGDYRPKYGRFDVEVI